PAVIGGLEALWCPDAAIGCVEVAALRVRALVERREYLLHEAGGFIEDGIHQLGRDVVAVRQAAVKRLDTQNVMEHKAQVGERGGVGIHRKSQRNTPGRPGTGQSWPSKLNRSRRRSG